MTVGFYNSWLPALSGGTINGDLVINGNLTVNGAATYVLVQSLLVEDKVITLNDGGAAGSGGGAGIQVEENSAITGSFIVNAARTGWELTSPADTNKLTIITPTASDETLTMSSSLHVSGSSQINQDCRTTGNPTFATVTVGNTGIHILDTNASHDLVLVAGSDLTADRNLTITTGDAARGVTLSGDLTVEAASLINQDLTTDSTVPAFGVLTLTRDNILVTGTTALLLQNTTETDAGNTVQYSPDIRLHGEAYRTGAGAERQAWEWALRNVPVTAAGAETNSRLSILASQEGAAFAEKLSIAANGNFSAGTANTLSANPGIAIGANNNVSGYLGCAIGSSCTVAVTGGLASGIGAVSNHYGEFARTSGLIASGGDSQYVIFTARRQTTDATANVELTADNQAAAASNRFTIADKTAYSLSVRVVGKHAGDAHMYSGVFNVAVVNNGGTTTGTVGAVVDEINTLAGTAAVAVAISDANDAVQVQVTGTAGETINWTATIQGVKVTTAT